ncbi:MAG: GNAT family N-acetyltransferase [Candidatus Sumerlaeaceae bacterium]|nr:GNAT family N-acetyltransferase [Candidatus Sumerlaeaceae bacterium]
MNLTIRPAREEELLGIAELVADMDPWKRLEKTSADLRKIFVADTLRKVFVACQRDLLAGTVQVRYAGALGRLGSLGVALDEKYRDGGYIHVLAAFPGFQGQQIGAALLDYAEALTSEVSPRVYLCVSEVNTGARKFYEHHGYRKIGAIENCLMQGNTEYIMLKDLS